MGVSENETKRAGRRQQSCRTQQMKLSMKINERDWLARRDWSVAESEDATKRVGRGKKSVGWFEV